MYTFHYNKLVVITVKLLIIMYTMIVISSLHNNHVQLSHCLPFLVCMYIWYVRMVCMYVHMVCMHGMYIWYVRMVCTCVWYVRMYGMYVRMYCMYIHTYGMYVRTYIWYVHMYVHTYGMCVRMVCTSSLFSICNKGTSGLPDMYTLNHKGRRPEG